MRFQTFENPAQSAFSSITEKIVPAQVSQHVYNSAFRFRASGALLLAASHQARKRGMTVSELMRHALRRELREDATATECGPW